MIYIGIDLGAHGGIAWINDRTNLKFNDKIGIMKPALPEINVIPMPTCQDTFGDYHWIDEKKIVEIFNEIWRIQHKGNSFFEPCQAVLEDINFYVNQNMDINAVKQLLIQNGFFRGLCVSLGIPYLVVHPNTWQKKMNCQTMRGVHLKNATSGMNLEERKAWEKEYNSKSLAIRECKNRFKMVSLIPPGHRVAHNGMADALLLAEYGRIHDAPY